MDEVYQYRNLTRGVFHKLQPEVGPDIFLFPLFSASFCNAVLDFVKKEENSHLWEFDSDGAAFRLTDFPFKEESRSNTGQNSIFQLFEVSGFMHAWELAMQWVMPIIHARWPTFEFEKIGDATVLRYDAKHYPLLKDHIDFETMGFIVLLNTNYSGGGTHFPKWNLTITGQEPGTVLMYPGGLSHVHGGRRVTGGERYVLLGDFMGQD